jgi:hypothetical protein
MEVVALDAACQLALPSSTSAALLASPANTQLLQSICTRAIGRTAGPPVRLAALHALASIAGVERAGEARDRAAALMSAGSENALRLAVFEAVAGAAGGVGAARSPAEAVLNLLQQPFDDTRTGVYRWVERCRILIGPVAISARRTLRSETTAWTCCQFGAAEI